jgi:hypothetical protein
LFVRFAFHGCRLESLPRQLRVQGTAAPGAVPFDPALLLDKSNELRCQSLAVSEERRQMLDEITHVARQDYLALRIQYDG